ncbi:baseplate J/gp47 family protein [Magnetospirillum molischianum]|uniref:Baseplate J family protein n=1 Tax=Magnetospirillum molischianum DSM 120 TaxID=1150626 RepID=H8FV05_MAGML|nr:baseplate J/gp47 family protein [Magnetospirillum molischianum]CCG42193.1 Baseplate J family protein [Magnetospirillum molischianum DSM 120]
MADLGLTRPTLGDLLDRTLADMLARMGEDEVLRRADAVVTARVAGYALHSLYSFALAIGDQILPDSANETALARHAAWWGVPRKGASRATGSVTLQCAIGAQVGRGVVLQRGGVDYVTTSSATATGPSVTVDIEAVTAGIAGNAPAGASLSLVRPLPGVQAKAVSGEISGGTEVEAVEAWRSRLRDRVQTPPHGGCPADYETWAKEVPGVTRAWCYPRLRGAGTVDVTFVMDGRDDIIPTAADVARVQAYIDAPGRKPATADVTVFASISVPINPHIRISPDTPEIRAAINAELSDFLRREAAPANHIRRSRLDEAISTAAGEVWHELAAPAADVILPAGQMSSLGRVTWLT